MKNVYSWVLAYTPLWKKTDQEKDKWKRSISAQKQSKLVETKRHVRLQFQGYTWQKLWQDLKRYALSC